MKIKEEEEKEKMVSGSWVGVVLLLSAMFVCSRETPSNGGRERRERRNRN